MNLEEHGLLTGALLIIYFYICHIVTVPIAVGFLFFGVLIDIDHFIDIYYNYKIIIFNVEKARNLHRRSKKLFIFFHDWELVPILVVISSYYPVFLFYALIYTLHLFSDNLANDVKPLAYSFIWRATQKFEGSLIHKTPIIDNPLEAYGAAILKIIKNKEE